jgi:hypothetical protein
MTEVFGFCKIRSRTRNGRITLRERQREEKEKSEKEEKKQRTSETE